MPRHERLRPDHGMRATIAATAARLMAEDGVDDYFHAKRKALRQLGLPEHTALPDNAEVEAALRTHLSLYRGEEQDALVAVLRRSALGLLEMLAPFHPYLTGSVLDGTAGEHSYIDILLFADSAKEVEIFLLNRGLDVSHVDPRSDKVEAVLRIETDTADANLIVMAPAMERVVMKHRDGRQRARIRADGLATLLAE